MNIKVIKTEEQYAACVEEAHRLTEQRPEPGSEQADRLELLSFLIENYEYQRMRIACPDAISAIRHAMEQRGMRQKDLAPMVGGKNRASEILSGKRTLTLNMIRTLSQSLRIPVDVLIRAPRTPDGNSAAPNGMESLGAPAMGSDGSAARHAG